MTILEPMLFDTALNTALTAPVVDEVEFTPSAWLLLMVNLGIYSYLIVTLVRYVSMIRL